MSEQRRQSRMHAAQITTPLAVAVEIPENILGDNNQRRWTSQPAVSPYGYPLADR